MPVGVLRRLLALLRLAFPQARFLVRLDGGFATPEIFDVLDLTTLVTMLVLGNILREIAIETFETLRVWWAG